MPDDIGYLTHGLKGAFYKDTANRALRVFRGELDPADQALAGVVGGQSSVALARQNAELGGVRGQMAQAAAGGALGARQAMFGGADAAHGIVGAAGSARQDEITSARREALAARLRQMKYFADLKAGMQAERFSNMRVERQQDAAALEAGLQASQQRMQQLSAGLNAGGAALQQYASGVDADAKKQAEWKAGG